MDASTPTEPSSTSAPPRRDELRVRKAKALILSAAGASFLLSVSLWFTGLREEGLFVGIWVPSILSLGSVMLQEGRRDD